MEQALERFRSNMQKMQSQGMDLGNMGRAFREVEGQARQGRIPLPGGGYARGGVDGDASSGQVELPGGGSVQGFANGQGSSGRVVLPGGLEVEGSAGADGAGGTVKLPGGWTIQGQAGEGMPSGDITGPDGQSLSGMLGKMFQGMNEGGMYTATLQGFRASVAMLKANGLDTTEVEGRMDAILPKLKELDVLTRKMVQYGARGEAPPEALSAELERRSDAIEPEMESISSEMERLSETMSENLQERFQGFMGSEDDDEEEDGGAQNWQGGLQKGLEGLGNLMNKWGN